MGESSATVIEEARITISAEETSEEDEDWAEPASIVEEAITSTAPDESITTTMATGTSVGVSARIRVKDDRLKHFLIN
jgi:hypothetical protein